MVTRVIDSNSGSPVLVAVAVVMVGLPLAINETQCHPVRTDGQHDSSGLKANVFYPSDLFGDIVLLGIRLAIAATDCIHRWREHHCTQQTFAANL